MSTGNIELDTRILLTDYAQSREEARYRDRLFYQFLYVVVIVGGFLVDALIRADSDLIRLFVLLAAFIIFFILSVATWSIKGSRDAVWENSVAIEKNELMSGLLKTNESIVNATKEGNWFERRHAGRLICWLVTVLTALSLGGVVFTLIRLIFISN